MDLLPSNPPHWHIVLNHFPSIGTLIALALFLAAAYWRSEDLRRASLILFLVMAILAIPTFITGHATKVLIQGAPGVSMEAIAAHQDAALWAFVLVGITGALSWFALWQQRRTGVLAPWNLWAIFIAAIITMFTMARAGNLGGHINHPEIWTADIVADPATGPTAAIEGWVLSSLWVWPALEVAHFIGMALLFGVVLFITLRVLGLTPNVSYPAIHRLLPLAALGFAVNVATGMVFYIAETPLFVGRPYGFYPKMVLVVIGGLAMIYFTLVDKVWDLRPGQPAALSVKAMAVVILVSWAGVLLFGRLLPYLEGL